jgi:hypothetical protein
MVYCKQSYDDQYDRHNLKTARAPIVFLNDELKSELGMKMEEDKEEDDAKLCYLKVPMDHEDKDSNTSLVKIKKCDTGMPEEFLRWRMALNEQIKNHGYGGNY